MLLSTKYHDICLGTSVCILHIGIMWSFLVRLYVTECCIINFRRNFKSIIAHTRVMSVYFLI